MALGGNVVWRYPCSLPRVSGVVAAGRSGHRPGPADRAQFQPLPTPRAKPAEAPAALPLLAEPSNAAEIRFTLNTSPSNGARLSRSGRARSVRSLLIARCRWPTLWRRQRLDPKYRNEWLHSFPGHRPSPGSRGGHGRIAIVEGYVRR